MKRVYLRSVEQKEENQMNALQNIIFVITVIPH